MYYHHTIGVFVPLAKRHYKQFILAFVALFFATIAMTTLAAKASTLETVTDNTANTSLGENNSEGWWFNRDGSTSSPYVFTGAEASIGSGSLYAQPISANPSDKFIAENFVFMSLSDLEELSYDFLVAGNGDASDANQFYLNVYTNHSGTDVKNFYECRFDFTPSTGSVANFTKFTITPNTTPNSVKSRGGAACPSTISGMEEGSTIRMYSISVGDTTTSDVGLAGYLDNVVMTTAADEVIYDFEPTPQLQFSLSGGGHITGDQTDVKKRKDKADISFGIDVEDYNIGTSGDVTIRFHDVSYDIIDKTTFHSSEITSFNYFTGTHSSCKSAANITAVGSLGGVEGYELIFRVGDAGSPGRGDTVRIELRDPEGTPVYDTHGGTDYNSISKCVGTARTALDNGNLTINKYD